MHVIIVLKVHRSRICASYWIDPVATESEWQSCAEVRHQPITDMLPVVHLQQDCGQTIRIPGIIVSVEVRALGEH